MSDFSRRHFVAAAGTAFSGLTIGSESALPEMPRQLPATGHDRKFICSDGLRNAVQNGQRGVIVKVRLPDYRSLPLSCIVGMELSIDSEKIDPSSIMFNLADFSHKLSDLAALHAATWWVLDTAELFVPLEQQLHAGEHDIAGTLIFLLPYATGGSITLQALARKRVLLEE